MCSQPGSRWGGLRGSCLDIPLSATRLHDGREGSRLANSSPWAGAQIIARLELCPRMSSVHISGWVGHQRPSAWALEHGDAAADAFCFIRSAWSTGEVTTHMLSFIWCHPWWGAAAGSTAPQVPPLAFLLLGQSHVSSCERRPLLQIPHHWRWGLAGRWQETGMGFSSSSQEITSWNFPTSCPHLWLIMIDNPGPEIEATASWLFDQPPKLHKGKSI